LCYDLVIVIIICLNLSADKNAASCVEYR